MAEASSPEEWPQHGGGALCRDLDGAVRCPICGELFETPLSLRCGHAFCSGCVRSSIEYQERSGPASCPQCRDRCDTADLRPAPQLRAIAAAFLAARPLLLDSVRAAIAATNDAAEEAPNAEPQPRGQPRRRLRQATQQQRQRPGRLRPRNQPAAPSNGNVISVELSNGSEDAPAAQPQAAKRRQQPKRGRAASAGAGDDEDTSQSTGSAKRQQLSSPSDEQQQQTPGPAAQNGRRLLRSNSRAAASAPASAGGGSGSGSGGGGGATGRRAGGKPAATANSDADDAVDRASDSDPEYLGEERVAPSGSSGGDAAAAPPPKQSSAREKLPSGHVRCPNCGTMLPQAFINSHLDSCLTGGGSGGRTAGSGKGSGGRGGTPKAVPLPNGVQTGSGAGSSAYGLVNGAARRSLGGGGGGAKAAGSSAPLKVPPKLCVALMSDKAMRDTCKKFGLPTAGRKEALAERYSRFRLEVQTANDSGEAGSYADCARRVLQRESRTAKAAFGAPLSRTAASSSPAGVCESSFEELIKATRQRQAAERATAAAPASDPAAAGAAAAAVDNAQAAPPDAGASALMGAAVRSQPAADAGGGGGGSSQPAHAGLAAGSTELAASAAAGSQGGLPAAQQQSAAQLAALGAAADGSQGPAAAAAATWRPPADMEDYPAPQPPLDEQSCSASRSLDAAPAPLQHGLSNGFGTSLPGVQSLAAAGGSQPHSSSGGAGAATDDHPDAASLGDVWRQQQRRWSSQQEAEGQQSDAAFGEASFDGGLLDGMTCTQRPPPLGPALSCSQQLQQPFSFEAVFSDDSRSWPLSPSV